MDALASSSWTELREMVKGKEWEQAVRAIKDKVNVNTRGKRYTRKGAQTPKRKKKKKTNEKGGKSKSKKASNKGDKTTEKNEDDSDEGEGEDGWRPTRVRKRKETLPPIQCNDGFTMSVQASRDHYSEPRDDQGPYTAVEVGYPNRLEDLMLPFADKATTVAGETPTLYVRVPAHIINAVVSKHAGIHSGRLPELADVDEDGVLWAAAAYVPSTTSEESEEEALTSVVHLVAPPPPPPPPLPPTPITTPTHTRRP